MGRLLDQISSPAGLADLSSMELRSLARELREEVVLTVARNGGHLASNLGVVELTLALHNSFDFLRDRLIWDVGHQSYIHKMLTGRLREFSTLRKLGGLSGFPKPEESPYDHFATGHSSTSISAALGMAMVRDLRKQDYDVVAVIGDGALTGGMAWEALNHAGDTGTHLIVVLNDNEMSISRNVGAMSAYLASARTAPSYLRTKADLDTILKRIPAVGGRLAEISERLKDSLKYFLVPGMIFEELGFTYLGPVDGHNITALRDMFEHAKSLNGPVLVHCLTTKGKGYRPAEQNPGRFHGTGPFNPVTGLPFETPHQRTFSDVFAQTLLGCAAEDPRIVAITAAMPEGTGLQRFRDVYPERFFDVGIAEQHAVTLAAGMAAEGFKPVFAVYSTFLQRAYDQVLHDVCLQNLPVVLAIDRAGLVGADGETHQGVYDLAMLRQMPNITVLAPRDEQELVDLLAWALEQSGPVAIRYPKGGADMMLRGPQPVQPGKAVCLMRGQDVLLINCGAIWDVTEAAVRELQSHGVSPTVYDARFVKPLDPLLIEEVGRHQCAAVLEEGVLAGGFGAAVLEQLAAQKEAPPRLLRFGVPDRFIPHGTRLELLSGIGLTGQDVAKAILNELRD